MPHLRQYREAGRQQIPKEVLVWLPGWKTILGKWICFKELGKVLMVLICQVIGDLQEVLVWLSGWKKKQVWENGFASKNSVLIYQVTGDLQGLWSLSGEALARVVVVVRGHGEVGAGGGARGGVVPWPPSLHQPILACNANGLNIYYCTCTVNREEGVEKVEDSFTEPVERDVKKSNK